MVQVIIGRHNETAGAPFVDRTGLNQPGGDQSDKFLACVPGVPQIRQLHEILRKALDLGSTWGRIP